METGPTSLQLLALLLEPSLRQELSEPGGREADVAQPGQHVAQVGPRVFDSSRYQSERLMAPAKDGAQVPVSLVYRKGLKKDGSAPLLLKGYGAYGAPSFVYFDSNLLSLLDRGMVVAVAHIRGGGDLGKPWHDAGRTWAWSASSDSERRRAASHRRCRHRHLRCLPRRGPGQ